jgi:hypothetical protein
MDGVLHEPRREPRVPSALGGLRTARSDAAIHLGAQRMHRLAFVAVTRRRCHPASKPAASPSPTGAHTVYMRSVSGPGMARKDGTSSIRSGWYLPNDAARCRRARSWGRTLIGRPIAPRRTVTPWASSGILGRAVLSVPDRRRPWTCGQQRQGYELRYAASRSDLCQPVASGSADLASRDSDAAKARTATSRSTMRKAGRVIPSTCRTEELRLADREQLRAERVPAGALRMGAAQCSGQPLHFGADQT